MWFLFNLEQINKQLKQFDRVNTAHMGAPGHSELIRKSTLA